MKKVVIIGNSDAADVLYRYMYSDPRWEVIGFCVDEGFVKERLKFDLPVVSIDQIAGFFKGDFCAVMGVGYSGMNSIRETLYSKVKSMGIKISSYIHPDSKVYTEEERIGDGSLILPGVIVEPYATIGENSVLWSGSVIGHHSVVGNNCWISSGVVVSGHCVIGNNSFLGVGSVISNGVCLAERNIVGAGGSVFKSTRVDEVYISAQSENHRFKASDFMKYFMR